MAKTDCCQRFIFEDQDVRGELVNLTNSYQELIRDKDYPEPVRKLLGEFLAASVLLSTTIKFDGRLVIQARSKGGIPLIMAECTSDKEVRGIARYQGERIGGDFNSLLKDGILAITIEPLKGESYQGIVPLEKPDLSQCLQEYFQRSEQLDTRLLLTVSESQCAGMLLQQLPAQLIRDQARRADGWDTITRLAATLSADELMQLDNEQILYRLFNQDAVKLYRALKVRHQCSCSRERTARALIALGKEEVMEIAAQTAAEILAESIANCDPLRIEISCEFCGKLYDFDSKDLSLLFETPPYHQVH